MWPDCSIYIILTVFDRQKAQEHLVLALWKNSFVTVLEHVAGISHTYLSIQAAISLFMDAYDNAPLRLPEMQD
jgi:gamma-glutamyl phosphate reductase